MNLSNCSLTPENDCFQNRSFCLRTSSASSLYVGYIRIKLRRHGVERFLRYEYSKLLVTKHMCDVTPSHNAQNTITVGYACPSPWCLLLSSTMNCPRILCAKEDKGKNVSKRFSIQLTRKQSSQNILTQIACCISKRPFPSQSICNPAVRKMPLGELFTLSHVFTLESSGLQAQSRLILSPPKTV